ncbi:DUF4352 domain-containing protein [Halorientalis salina]|uniref:DUF4352 domain-containing protein n=1 Tax=Halorientalis salina TaxID=2932266 RepID=UPI00145CF48D|nr:DUF4352 domain-containing protein [Halorientalis salina]
MKLGSIGILLGGAGVGSLAALNESNPDQAADSTVSSPTASGSENLDQSGTTSHDESSSQQGQTGDGADALFQVSELRAPSEVEIGTEYTVEVVVTNTGGSDGTYNSAVTADPHQGTDRTIPVELSIPAGETRTQTLTETIQTLSTTSYEIDQQQTAVTGKRRTEPVGTPVTSRDVRITVDNLSEEGETYQGYESENGKFIVGEITAQNVSDESEMQYLPAYLNFNLFDPQRNNQYEPVSLGIEFDNYETANVRSGVRRSGPIVFDVPQSIELNDLVVFYHKEIPEIIIEWEIS